MALGQYSGGIGAIAGAIVGGIVGYYTGYGAYQGAMIGASLGGMAGGVAGSVLWPEKINPDFPPPPQPNENRTQISTYGTPIPIVYASSRLAGNIIYMSDINNTVVRSKHRQDGVRYYEIVQTYTSTFAVAFCEGPVTGIARIWLNGKIFVDFRDPSGPYYPSGSTALASGNLDASIALSQVFFSIYFGTETQTSNAAISAILGAADTPPYRGICYIVFIDFPVGEFSGVPTVEVEIGEVDEIVNGSPGSTVPAEVWNAIGFTDWTEIDFANDMTVGASEVTLSGAGNGALCIAYRITAFGQMVQVRGSFTITALDGANYQEVDILQLQDGGANTVYIRANINATAVGLYLLDAIGSDSHSYTGVSYPFTRYYKLVITGIGTAELRIYTDSGYTTLEDTLYITNTGMSATPSIAYAAVGDINALEETNRSLLSMTIAVPEVLA